jgi:ribosomal protein S18 acetylase RimI-like enzyme
MLYHALHVPEGQAPFLQSVVDIPELSKYFRGWGRAGDMGFVAIERNSVKVLGAVWARAFTACDKGYGYIDDETPELSVAVMPEYRGQGIGTDLLRKLMEESRLNVRALSLSVSPDNPAVRLYRRLGFDVFSECEHSLTMRKRL